MALSKVVIAQAAARLAQPFIPINLVTVNDMAVNLIICAGKFQWHRHEQMDEIFYVHSGSMLLETEIGSAVLNAGELIFAPANVAHCPSAAEPSLVLFFLKYHAFPRNGDRNTLPRHSQLPGKVKLRERSERRRAWQIEDVAMFDDFAARAVTCEGAQPWHEHPADDEMVLAHQGPLRLEVGSDTLELESGDLAVVPHDQRHRLSASARASALLISRISAQTPE
ncbi:MAG: cupin domain-containing protein [Chloroflexi bacterium]|nr:cupin domain-containing protein [Chloroflexota bacterium]